ncbi:MAG: AAA family ATPase [Prevotella sp.]|nr:AAA family ATPase [Prevotella sp.]
MKIIGIHIYDGDGHRAKSPTEVLKGLKAGWFPFGDYPEPQHVDGRWTIGREFYQNTMYNLFEDTPKVYITGIVGKNGSGKSTLIDYLLMIINNSAYYMLDDQYASDEQKPQYAYGVYAKLYVETNGVIRRIKCMNQDVFYSDGQREQYLPKLDYLDKKLVMSDLFFAVLCNFGAYSLNSRDYLAKSKLHDFVSKVNGGWLDGIFALDQNYIFPVIVTPQRHGGNFDVNLIKEESMEKLIALMLYSQFRGYSFMPGYTPSRITYQYDESLGSSLTDKLLLAAKGKEVDYVQLCEVKSAIISGWARYLQCEQLYLQDRLDKNEEKPHEVFMMLLEYCACQTVHLCIYYDRFRQVFDIIDYLKTAMRNKENVSADNISHVDDNILYQAIEYDGSNMTYGIRKCILTIRETLQRGLTHNPFLKKKGRLQVAKLVMPEDSGLENVLSLLPPPLFKLDVLLKKDNSIPDIERFSIENKDAEEIFISKLSSGEKQWLYSLSTTLFHIKYVEDTLARPKGLRYSHILLVFDEAELYYHPDYQRNFVFNLLKYLSWLNLVVIESIEIVIATHSPFILSDMMKENILFMRDGTDYRRTMTNKEAEEFQNFNTFGANYYDLLRNGFFLGNNAIGKFATQVINNISAEIEQGLISDSLDVRIEKIADPLIKGYLMYALDEKKKQLNVQNQL